MIVNFGITEDSFIFSFSSDSIENYILSRVNNETKAIYIYLYDSPSFGIEDLYFYFSSYDGLKISCWKSDYEKEIIAGNDISLDFF
jgi:hypothetical protein